MTRRVESMSDSELRAFRRATAAAIAQVENRNSRDPEMNAALARMLEADDALEALDAEADRDRDVAEKLLSHAIQFLGHHRWLLSATKESKRRAARNN